MRRPLAVLVIVAVVLFLSAAEVRAGGASLVQPTKTTGPAVSFTVVTVIADTAGTTKGQTALRVQKSNTFDGALFSSSYVSGFAFGCILPGFTLDGSTDERFLGFMDAWSPFAVRSQLLGKLGNPSNAAVTDINDVSCSTVGAVTSLSFTGTIQFQP